jgi:hypothetical protein
VCSNIKKKGVFMPELQVSKKTLKQLFGGMQGHKFIIPDFQRPYKWERKTGKLKHNGGVLL